MEVFDTPHGIRRWADERRRRERSVGLVPTMGALHDGHLALIAEAKRRTDDVVMSIFVNPLQFNLVTDFDRYPRPIDDDLAAAATAGVAAVYAPTAATMYPPGFQTHVEPGPLAAAFEGEHRPGHFRGVTTVVSKLFAAVHADVAVFGQKDAQQLAIIRRMALDLDMGTVIVALPTVREVDGVAMSSRNRLLSPGERIAARCIWRGLTAAARHHAAGERDGAVIESIVAAEIGSEPLARAEYVAAVDPDTFERAATITSDALVVVAAWVGTVRLIDNIGLAADHTVR